MPSPRTLFEKLWDRHLVRPETDTSPAILYVDLHLVHEVTSPQAFTELRERGLAVRQPGRTIATMDHSTPTTPRAPEPLRSSAVPVHDPLPASSPRGRESTSAPGFGSIPVLDARAAAQLAQLDRNCRDFGVPLLALGSDRQGIVHVIGPELGLTQPGMTIVCGDSHTSTHGAFGALAFGIGTSEVGHVLATQCLLQNRPRTMEIRVDGRLRPGVTAKDLILAIIAEIGVGGGTGHVLEYTGEAIRALGMEERMTVCNMSIEAGARAGLISPDDTTFAYLAGRPHAPHGAAWERALVDWRGLATDAGAEYDATVTLDGSAIRPMITYGTNPGMGIPVDGVVPDPAGVPDAARRAALVKALRYMDLEPGRPLLGKPVDVVFVGSCTNSRITDLRLAADAIRGHRVAPGVRMLVVPGSQQVKREAEAAGLHRVFTDAGAEWREAGCSMCIAMNGDELAPGQYSVSTSNRNFEGRQGKGGRTFLASPLTAVAAAVTGRVSDAREVLRPTATPIPTIR
jgi:3-isopropylmalate/(R)-2-methylmalate dehydratase large subunit